MVGRQLPIIDVPEDKSIWYALRMTPLGKYTSVQLEEFIKGLTNTYVFSQELSKKEKEHYHCVLNVELDDFELRERVREFLRKMFPGPAKRGDANKQYNLSECIDPQQSIVYILKDGGELHYGDNIDSTKLESYKKLSYKKYDGQEFSERLNEIKTRVKDTPNMKMVDIMALLINLKVTYRQPVNMNYLYQLSLSLYLHNNPDRIVDFITQTNYYFG